MGWRCGGLEVVVGLRCGGLELWWIRGVVKYSETESLQYFDGLTPL